MRMGYMYIASPDYRMQDPEIKSIIELSGS